MSTLNLFDSNQFFKVLFFLAVIFSKIFSFIFEFFIKLILKHWKKTEFWMVVFGVVLVLCLLNYFLYIDAYMRALTFKDLAKMLQFELFDISASSVYHPKLLGFNKIILGFWAVICRLFVYYLFFSLAAGFVMAFLGVNHGVKKTDQVIAYEDYVKKVKIPQADFEMFRKNANGIFLGINKLTKKEVTLTYRQANKHTLVMGPTGMGKTTSVILPMMYHNFKKGHPCVVFDFKGSSMLELKTRALLKLTGREEDLLFFSLTEPEKSNKYNCLLHGDTTELKDKILASKEWSEPYYKSMSESVLITIFNVFKDQGSVPTLKKIRKMLRDPKGFKLKGFESADIEKSFSDYKHDFLKVKQSLSGLDSFVHSVIESAAGGIFDTETSEIDFLEAYDNNKILYFKIPAMKYVETSKHIARMILADLKVACSTLQDRFTYNFKYFPVIIDEAKSIMFDGFDDFLSRARDIGISITFTTHSPSDFKTDTKDMATSIFQNVGNKVLFRLKDGATIESFNRSLGTYETVKYTSEVSDTAFGQLKTGRSSMREVDKFRVDPNILRNLKVGESVVVIDDLNKYQVVLHDYINPDVTLLKREFAKEQLKKSLKKGR